MPHRRILPRLLLTAALIVAPGCDKPTPDTDPVETTTAAAAPTPAPQRCTTPGTVQQLVERAQQARDRDLKSPPRLDVVERFDTPGTNAAGGAATPEIAGEVDLLSRILFDIAPAQMRSDLPRPPWQAIARYVPTDNRILCAPGSATPEQVETAILAALIEAIDTQHTPTATRPPTSWDAALAADTARRATVLFALMSDQLRRAHPDVNLDLLAKRPELATTLDSVGTWLSFGQTDGDNAQRLRARQQSLMNREAWKFAAALYRSNGWSGVELARATPPMHTLDLARPDLWMRGEPLGEWRWPKDDDAQKSQATKGSVGPGLISIWLEDTIDPRLAQSVFAGYVSDAWRAYPAPQPTTSPGTPPHFEWLSMWSTSGSAEQIAGAFEKRLRQRFSGHDLDNPPFLVFTKGLVVGVIIGEPPADTPAWERRRARAAHLLDAHHLALRPRAQMPLEFRPTRADGLVAHMAHATLDARVWQDPATNLRMDLTALGDGWQVQQPDLSELRWFAQHQDGALLQLSVALDNPLGPGLASDAYRDTLAKSLLASMKAAALDTPATPMLPTPDSVFTVPGIVLQVRGRIDGHPRVLKLWTFQRGDLLISYSLQSPPDQFDAHEKLAAAILASTQNLSDEPAIPGDAARLDSADDGIEYHVED